MKLWAMLVRATQDKLVTGDSVDKMWYTGGENSKPLQHSSHENPIHSTNTETDMTPEGEPPRLEAVQYATGEEREAITNSSRKNEAVGPKQKWHSPIDVSGDKSKVWCCKEQYCTGTWNVRTMNQSKLHVVKQEMARVNFKISELKWTGEGKFNSDDRYIFYWGEESQRRNRVAITVNKRIWNTVFGWNLKNDNDLGSRPRKTIQHHSNLGLQARILKWLAMLSSRDLPDSGSDSYLLHLLPYRQNLYLLSIREPIRSFRTDTHSYTFHHRGLKCKSRKSRGKIEFGVQNEAGKRLTEFCQKKTLVTANTIFQQYKRWLYTWTSLDGQHQNQIDYTLCSQRCRGSILSAKTRPGADYAQIMISLLPNSDLNWRKYGKPLDHSVMT